jgi:hypothetical protein
MDEPPNSAGLAGSRVAPTHADRGLIVEGEVFDRKSRNVSTPRSDFHHFSWRNVTGAELSVEPIG